MTDQPSADLAALLAHLVEQQSAVFQQQAAMVQQQAALLQAHGESIQLQRLLVERILGLTPMVVSVSQSEPTAPVSTSRATAAPLAPPVSVAPTSVTATVAPPRGPQSPEPEHQPDPYSLRPESEIPGPPAAGTEAGIGPGATAAYAAWYYRSRPAPSATPVQPQHLELMRRLHEMRDVGELILQFGPHRGNTLAQAALHDPDYVRQLVIGAQRPEVRAAAGRLVEALDAAAAHKPRAGRSTGRRSRSTT